MRSALNGGTYNVYASYKGDPIYGGSSSSKTYTFTVAQAASTATLSTPAGVSPINGVYYVQQGSSTVMTATVTSKQGTPTGSVTFMNGSTVLGTSPLNASGTATFNTSGLAAGPVHVSSSARSTTSPRFTAEISTLPRSRQRPRPSRSFRRAR